MAKGKIMSIIWRKWNGCPIKSVKISWGMMTELCMGYGLMAA